MEALGADMARIAAEIEKLALYAGSRAGGRRRYRRAGAGCPRHHHLRPGERAGPPRPRRARWRFLDTLTREGEYLPLALAFLSTQFRMALVAREAGLKSSQQVQAHFTRQGVPMWGSRAEQVCQTAAKFASRNSSAP